MNKHLKKKIIISIAIVFGLALIFSSANKVEARPYKNGQLIRRKSGGTVYRIKKNENVKRPILSPDVFKSYRYNWNNINGVRDRVVDRISTGEMIVYKSGTLLTSGGSGTIWVIERPRRRFIPNMKTFRMLGYKWKNIKKIRHKKLRRIPYGGNISLNVNNMISVTANKTFNIRNSRGKRLVRLGANRIAKVGYSKGTYVVNVPHRNKTVMSSRWVYVKPRRNGIVELPGYDKKYKLNRFRNRVDIRNKGNRLWAINRLRMERYLPGMLEAGNVTDRYGDKYSYMEAMTVIARSYAGYYVRRGGRHHTNLFDLKNSRYDNGSDQVFGGFKAETKHKRIAARRTRGEYVTNQNNRILITPYSHGGYVKEGEKKCERLGGRWRPKAKKCMRTKSSEEVWGGSINHCQPVKDRFGDTGWECGTGGNHCVGLSASGAINYADRNDSVHWGYKRILKHYYSGIKVKDKNWNPNIKIGIYSVKS